MIGTCTKCREPCNVILVDFGIGPYEYWGAPGVDTQITAVSQCCEEPVVNRYNQVITASDVKRYYDEFKY